MRMPENIASYADLANRLEKSGKLSPMDGRRLAVAKMKIAVWACAAERLPLTRFALAEILGPDTAFVFANAVEEMLSLPWECGEDREMAAKMRSRLYPQAPDARPAPALGRDYI